MKPRPAPTALRPDGARTADAADDGANARPSIRTLARQCGVSRMTVSRALRNDPHVRSAVRERVCAMALAAGYAGNPFLSAWMAEMRRARRRTLRCGLAWICGPLGIAAWETRPELSGYLRGARERAAALGYALDPVALPADASAGRIVQILLARGLRGAVVPPGIAAAFASALPDDFALARIGGAPDEPGVRAVAPHYAANLLLAWDELRRAGRRRIGLCVSAAHVRESECATLAAFLARQAEDAPEDEVPALILPTGADAAPLVARWCRQAWPNAAITDLDGLPELAERPEAGGAQEMGFAHLDWHAGLLGWSGIDRDHRLLGAAAVEAVAARVERKESGALAHCDRVLAKGRWVGGGATRRVAFTKTARAAA
jgi:LacI family transcriptional regulator